MTMSARTRLGIAMLIAGVVVLARPPLAGQLAPEPMDVMSAGRAAVLFAYLAVSSLVARLVVLGVMDMMGN
jgi:hypothetical protein